MGELPANIKEKCHDVNLRLVRCEEQWPPRHSSRLVELNLVERGKRESYKSASGKRNPICYGDLLKPSRKIRKVLVEGGAGMGKTNFCVSISEKWVYGTLFQEYQLVLFLPLYKENIISSSNFPSKWLHEFDPAVDSYIREKKGKGVLIIADGWDRLNESLRLETSFLYRFLFKNRSLGYVTVIVTSRPTVSAPLHEVIDRFIEIDGFSVEGIIEYIQSEFPTSTMPQNRDLIEQIRSNPLTLNVCNIPLNSTIICHLWCELEDDFPSTVTELYTEIILNVLFRNVQVGKEYSRMCSPYNIEDAVPDDLKDSWQHLCQLAFQLMNRDPILPPSKCVQSGMDKFGLAEFIIEKENVLVCHFLHQAFLEYLASLHVVKQSPNSQMEILKSLGRSKRLNVFWQCFFGNSMQYDHIDIFQHAFFVLSNSGHDQSLMICLCAFEAGNINDIDIVINEAVKALHTNTHSVHFGHPCSIHECNAILYVMDNMNCLECRDSEMELSFKDCSVHENQLCKLADILIKLDGKHNLRGFDLSGNDLSDKSVADLFSRASAVFQSLEKLFICKNKIGEIGLSAIMETLGRSASPRIKQIDLSFNPLGVSGGLDVLLKALNDGTLRNLEILFLQGSFTLNPDANIQYLNRLADALLSHYQQLQRLDLSRNDFGESALSIIDSIIGEFMFHFGGKFDVRFNREYMSKVEENYVAIMDDAVKQKGMINYTAVHGVIVGPGRSGKDSLMRRLMGLGPPDSTISSSTGVLEKVIKIEVKKLCTVAVAVDDLVWKRLDYDEEAIELIMTTVKYHSDTGNTIPDPDSDSNGQIIPSARVEVENKYNRCVNRVRVLKAKGSMSNCEHFEEEANDFPIDLPSESERLDIFKRALQLRHMDALRDHLESSWSLYLTNTGGQMEFQELLPLLVCGPTVFFVTFPLNIGLQEHYTVRYQYTDGSEISYPSPSTLRDEILQTLATIASLDCTGPQHDYVHLKPKVFIVGTHKDQLPQLSALVTIQKIDEQLRTIIEQTSLFRQGSVEFAIGTQQLMFTVNNLDQDDSDFKKLRLAVQKAVERCEEFTVSCPSSWLIFSLILRSKYRSSQILSYSNCFAIAQCCGISDRTELNEALLFIHARLGLIRYFSVKDLNTVVVIDPEILFDNITKLIVGTFISDHATTNEIQNFQRGIFSIKGMEAILDTKLHSQTGAHLSSRWLLKLLKHLRIAAVFRDFNGEQKCFFPSVICHAPKQQSVSCSRSSLLPPPLLIAFKNGFCPRGIPGALITYLMTNEMKSKIFWEFYEQKIFQNQVTFNIGSCDIILKIRPTHLEFSLDPESNAANDKIKETCEEVFTQIQVAMKAVTARYRECDYYIALDCTKCKPWPAMIEWDKKTLHCSRHNGRVRLPSHYDLWIPQKGGLTRCQIMDQVVDHESGGVPTHLGQVADSMCEWEGRIAEGLCLTTAEVNNIKYKHKDNLELQKREALQKWKEKQGSEATYKNLIKIFKHAGYELCADVVRNLVSECRLSDQMDKSSDSEDQQTSLPPASPPPPPHLSEFPESVTLTAATVQLEKEHQESNGTDQNFVHVKAEEVVLISHKRSSVDVEDIQHGNMPIEDSISPKKRELFEKQDGFPNKFSKVQKQMAQQHSPLLSESLQIRSSSDYGGMTYSQGLDQVLPDCENKQVPTLHDPVANTMCESEERIIKGLDLKPVEVADEQKDNLEFQMRPVSQNFKKEDSGQATYNRDGSEHYVASSNQTDKSSDIDEINRSSPMPPPPPQLPELSEIVTPTTATVLLEKESAGQSTISPEVIAARVGLDAKELERPCEEGLFPSFTNYVHPWRLVFSDLLAPIDLDDVDLECHSEQEKTLGCLHKWKARNGAKATVGAVVGSVLRNGSVDSAESMCRCLLPGTAIVQNFETLQVPSAATQSSASLQSPGSVQSLEMICSNEEVIKSYFSSLLLRVQSALESKQDVSSVRQFLINFFKCDFPETSDLDKLFSAVTLNGLWDYQHHGPLEQLINHFLPGDQELLSLMKTYKARLSGFYLTTKIIDYIQYQNLSADDSGEECDQPSPKQYKKIEVELKLDWRVSDLSLDYVQRLWSSLGDKYKLPSLTLKKIAPG